MRGRAARTRVPASLAERGNLLAQRVDVAFVQLHGLAQLRNALPGILPSSYRSSDMGVGNSPGEQQVVSELLATQRGDQPKAVPAWSTMMVAPMFRGAEVTVS